MTIDREQIRTEAENALHAWNEGGHARKLGERLVRSCLALLTELEQAEKDLQSAIGASVEALGYSEARLAKVPALVEAIKDYFATYENQDAEWDTPEQHEARIASGLALVKALAEWERE